VNAETKEQSKQWIYSPNKPKKFKKHCLPARKLITVFWDRKEVLMMEFMQEEVTTKSEVHCKTPKKTA
jgi:hypothetical protein